MGSESEPAFSVLVFSRTTGFRHASIAAGVAAVEELGAVHDFSVVATEDPAAFSDVNLSQFAVVVFLNTTGDVLDLDQQAAFERFIRAGGGFVGVHSAADTEYDWPWYGGLVGAYFQSHPAISSATIKVADAVHPSTDSLPRRWQRTDEWYNFQINPRGDVHVLATIDESTYVGGTHGFDHPIAWCHLYDGGRAWYTAGGHTTESFAEPLYREHLAGGILCAAGARECDCSATLQTSFQKSILVADTDAPMNLAVAPDGRVFFVERTGAVRIYKPETGLTVTAAQIDVFTENEDGLLGIALDPDFAGNGWVYLYYSPAGPESKQHVSRFIAVADTLDITSELVLLEIPTQREQCCHSAGDLTFDAAGDLYISVGDNTSPFGSAGFTPIDERPGRAFWDAQRTAGNTNDLRGKILRITPQPDGTYTIPAGNLFPADGSAGLPEIYAMGCRNPFRIDVDTETGWLYWGDLGPDSCKIDFGLDEFNRAQQAGNFGWPYCIGDNHPFREFDFETDVLGPDFDCLVPVNDSPNNTGAVVLPAAQPAWLWYPYGPSIDFPELGVETSRAGMVAGVYHFDPALDSPTKLPEYYDDTLFVFEWSRNWMKEIKFDENGDLLVINSFLPQTSLVRPIDMEIGPDGAIYIVEWGSSFFGSNQDSQVIRLSYVRDQREPIARINADVTSGPVPLAVRFSSMGSFDPDSGETLSYAWDFDTDGSVDSTEPNPIHVYDVAGDYTATLTVTDPTMNSAQATMAIAAGNSAPQVTITAPPNGGFFEFGQFIRYQIAVNDVDDLVVDCGRVSMNSLIGHDTHAHPDDELDGCSGFIQTVSGDAHPGGTDLSYVLEARYTDNGAAGVAPLSGRAVAVIKPKIQEAEHYTTQSGIAVEATTDTDGCSNLTEIDHGDYISYVTMNLLNIHSLRYRTASANFDDARIEVRVGSAGGPVISTATIPATADWDDWTDVTAPITDPHGTNELFFVFARNEGDTELFKLNWIEFVGPGIGIDCDSDEDGDQVVDCLDQCPMTPVGDPVDDEGCSIGPECVIDQDCDDSYACTIDTCDSHAHCRRALNPAEPCDVQIRLNCGTWPSDPSYTDTAGRLWLSDRLYAESASPRFGHVGGGLESCPLITIGGTNDPALYTTARVGFDAYRFDVPPGFYAVRLKFADACSQGIDQRRFDVFIENEPVVLAIDLVASVGKDYAIDYTFGVWVDDGVLSVSAADGAGDPLLAAVSVVSVTPDDVPPAVPQDPLARGGFYRNILIWDANEEPDWAGYFVYRADAPDGPFVQIATEPVRTPRFFDDSAVVGTEYFYEVRAFDIWGNVSAPAATLNATALDKHDSLLPVYELTIAPQDLATLNADPMSDDFVPAAFSHAGIDFPDVEARYRGQLSRLFPKKNFKVKFSADNLFANRRKVNLQGQFDEASLMREALAYSLYTIIGTPSAAFEMVHLMLNGAFGGVYLDVEQINERFLARNGLDTSGNLYKVILFGEMQLIPNLPEAVHLIFGEETNEDGSYEDLIHLITTVNTVSDEEFPVVAHRMLDLPQFLDWYAMAILTGNNDFATKNHFLYHDPTQDKWMAFPWDLQHTFGLTAPWDSAINLGVEGKPDIFGLSNLLLTRLMSVGAFRDYHAMRLTEWINSFFNPEAMDPNVDGVFGAIAFDARRDVNKLGWERNEFFEQGPDDIKDFISARGPFLLEEIESFAPGAGPYLFINEVMTTNTRTVADEAAEFDPWIEIYNAGVTEVDLGGMFLTNDPLTPNLWQIPLDVPIPGGGHLLFWADSQTAQGPTHAGFELAAGGGIVALFDFEGATLIDVAAYSSQPADVSQGKMPDGSANWSVRDAPSPGTWNYAVNQPPAIFDTTHDPPNPTEKDSVVITCRVEDDSAVDSVTLFASIGEGFDAFPIRDDGTSGDAEAGDGVWSGRIPPLPRGTVVNYYVSARDDQEATSRDPAGAPVNIYSYTVGRPLPQLVINEFMADNDTTMEDEFNEFDDWLELYNYGTESIDLGGMYLTDDLADPTKWRVPDGAALGPDEFMIIWADNDPEQGDNHTSFRLALAGEEIGLFDTDENNNQPVDTVIFGPQASDVSFGRLPDAGKKWRFLFNPTPGFTNMLPGDLNLDGVLNVWDFAVFLDCFSGQGNTLPPACDASDFDADQDVDFNDFAAFQIALSP
ncbi:MAG: ThuA domain-containing protein [Phycisphaerae bacterium]